MKHQTGCLICGTELVYLDTNETQRCAYCGETFESNARCGQGHFVCDGCHSADAETIIKRFCLETSQTNPLEIAITLMRHPALAMHGPEHHFLVPAVLLSAYYNQQGGGEKPVKIEQARIRAGGVRGGSCGQCGACGAAVGSGIFVSLITGATPLTTHSWRLSNRMTAECLLEIADHGGPRCCKRDTFLALQTTQRFLQQHFGLRLNMPVEIECEFHYFNRECLHNRCPFYPGADN